ncbi:hypothetical protein CXG81DRAFT_4301, partial [Caulochytrium protostelioides]
NASGMAFVKSVLSGDTVILRSRPINGPPTERLVSLAAIVAPRLGGPRDPEKEEPFGFLAREFLRRRLVGKEVYYRVLYTVPGGRDYAVLQTQAPIAEDQVVVQKALVAAGWAVPKEGRNEIDAELEYLHDVAKHEQKGKYDPANAGLAARTVDYNLSKEDAQKLYAKHKGKPLPAVIEQVKDGSTYRVLVKVEPDVHVVLSLQATGLRAPMWRKGIPNLPDIVEPFSEESKFYVEARLLQKDVQVLLENVGNNSNALFGSVLYPLGDIGEALLKEGLAKCADFSILMVTGGPGRYRAAEAQARERRLRIWRDVAVKAPVNAWEATVTRVISGDTLMVSSRTKGEQKVTLSSIRIPRDTSADGNTGSHTSLHSNNANSDQTEMPYFQYEAREAIRKRVIGKTVTIAEDYVTPANAGYEARTCVTILSKNVNLAEMLVGKGLALVIRHRRDDDRSSSFDQLLMAEERAKAGKVGIHATTPMAPIRFSEVSKSAQRAKIFMTQLTRLRRFKAVVDFVVSGSRFRVIVPGQNLRMTLVLDALRTPRTARNASETSEPFGAEATQLANQHLLQRDVEVEVTGQDKTGGITGNVFVDGTNFGAMLLEAGYATLHSYSAQHNEHYAQLTAAAGVAERQKLGVWSIEKPAAEPTEESATAPKVGPHIDENGQRVVVTDYAGKGQIHIQTLGEGVQRLETMMQTFSDVYADAAQPALTSAKNNDVIAAQFTVDDHWYRARVLRTVNKTSVNVIYVDYGNTETLPLSRCKRLVDAHRLSVLPAQATAAQLAFVQMPAL